MKQTTLAVLLCSIVCSTQAQQLYTPRNVLEAYKKETRSPDGKPGKNYWQNTADYDIAVRLSPPARTITGTETIVYTNNSPTPLQNIIMKLILNIQQSSLVEFGDLIRI